MASPPDRLVPGAIKADSHKESRGDESLSISSTAKRSSKVRRMDQKPLGRGRTGPSTQESPIALVCGWIVAHQLAIALTLLTPVVLLHLTVPHARSFTRLLVSLSYQNAATGKYALGIKDALFVCFWIVLLSGLRAGVIDYLLTPLASRAGIGKKKAKVRFAEQAWILCHHSISWLCGMYIWYNSTYWFSLRAMWRNYPIRELDGPNKYYYLVEFAFWLQQLVVVNIEERRKDHLQMFTHHIITCTLILTSYCYHFTPVGNVILCIMDLVDLFLPLAKIFKYLNFRLLCDITFGAFMITWFIARHIFYMAVCWSLYSHLPAEVEYGCYRGSGSEIEGPFPPPQGYGYLIQPFTNPTGLVCATDGITRLFLWGLLALQGILLIWLSMIVKVAYKVICGDGADDVRSDDEDSEVEDETEDIDHLHLCCEPQSLGSITNLPIEKEVGYEDLRHSPSRLTRNSSARRSKKSEGHGAASGVSLRSPSNRKELLGRIGCDKGS